MSQESWTAAILVTAIIGAVLAVAAGYVAVLMLRDRRRRRESAQGAALALPGLEAHLPHAVKARADLEELARQRAADAAPGAGADSYLAAVLTRTRGLEETMDRTLDLAQQVAAPTGRDAQARALDEQLLAAGAEEARVQMIALERLHALEGPPGPARMEAWRAESAPLRSGIENLEAVLEGSGAATSDAAGALRARAARAAERLGHLDQLAGSSDVAPEQALSALDELTEDLCAATAVQQAAIIEAASSGQLHQRIAQAMQEAEIPIEAADAEDGCIRRARRHPHPPTLRTAPPSAELPDLSAWAPNPIERLARWQEAALARARSVRREAHSPTSTLS